MTRKGWHTIIIREKDYHTLKELAERKNKKISEIASEVIGDYIENHKGELNL